MSIKVAINGFGRIGRSIARAIYENKETNLELVAINARGPIESLYNLFKYDSIHGRFSKSLKIEGDNLIIDGHNVSIYKENEPRNIPWKDHDVDVVFECTGIFKDQITNQQHLDAGAKKVIISSPAKDNTKMIIYGVNDNILTKNDRIVSIGSCTTNCLAPVAKILNDNLGIETGFVTTIHATTNDQNITDARHKDLRRARAAYLSMIPTSTGAAKVIGKIIPELNGKLDGTAIRVPTANVSMIDFCFTSKKSTSIEEVNDIVTNKRLGNITNILQICNEELVSIDFNHTEASAIFDLTATKILNGNFVRVAAWYDNEWAFSLRMIDVAKIL